LRKIWTAWVGRTSVTDDRQTTDGRAIAYSEREREFTFAKNQWISMYFHCYILKWMTHVKVWTSPTSINVATLPCESRQELISRWYSEHELLRSVPRSYPNSLKKRKITPLRRSRSFKVTDFGTTRKLIYDFLLVINTNLPTILHRFRDIAVDRSEIAILG